MGSSLVYVIVLNFNGLKHLKYCIPNVLEGTYENFRVLLVDNGSTDNSLEFAKKFRQVEVIENNENLGFSGGVNVGIKRALLQGADFIALLNNDSMVEKQWIEKALRVFAWDDKIGLVGCDLNPLADKDFNPHGAIVKGSIEQFKKVLRQNRPLRFNVLEEGILSGSGLFVKREVFEKAGLFDPVYFLYDEELDFETRARRAGFKLVQTNISNFHQGSGITENKAWKRKASYLQIRNNIRCSIKNFGVIRTARLALSVINNALNPFKKVDRSLNYFDRLRYSDNVLLNVPIVLKALLWNLVFLPSTLAAKNRDRKIIEIGSRKKRVLCISHSAYDPLNRILFIELAKFPDWDVSVIVPTRWHTASAEKTEEINLRERNEAKMVLGNTVFTNHMHLHFYSKPFLLNITHSKPDIIFLQEEPGSMVALQAFVVSLLSGAKLVFHTNENLVEKRRWLIFRLIERLVFSRASSAFILNTECEKILRKKGFIKKASLLYLGIDNSLYSKKRSPDFKKSLGLRHFTIGFGGRLTKEKGLLTLVDAASTLDFEFNILVVGKGPFEKDFLDYAEKKKIRDRIVVTNASLEEVSKYLNCMDVVVLPSESTSVWKEQFGRILLGGMAVEVPVIGSSSGAIPEIIGDAGLVFKEGKPSDLARKLTAIKNDQKLAASLVARGKERLKKEFLWPGIALKLKNELTEVLIEPE